MVFLCPFETIHNKQFANSFKCGASLPKHQQINLGLFKSWDKSCFGCLLYFVWGLYEKHKDLLDSVSDTETTLKLFTT